MATHTDALKSLLLCLIIFKVSIHNTYRKLQPLPMDGDFFIHSKDRKSGGILFKVPIKVSIIFDATGCA